MNQKCLLRVFWLLFTQISCLARLTSNVNSINHLVILRWEAKVTAICIERKMISNGALDSPQERKIWQFSGGIHKACCGQPYDTTGKIPFGWLDDFHSEMCWSGAVFDILCCLSFRVLCYVAIPKQSLHFAELTHASICLYGVVDYRSF